MLQASVIFVGNVGMVMSWLNVKSLLDDCTSVYRLADKNL